MALGVTQGSHTRNKTEWEFPGDGRREEWEVRKGGWRQPQHSCVNGLHATWQTLENGQNGQFYLYDYFNTLCKMPNEIKSDKISANTSERLSYKRKQ